MRELCIARYIRRSLQDGKCESMSCENQPLVLKKFVSSVPEATDAEGLEFIDN